MNPFDSKDPSNANVKAWAEVVGLVLALSALAKLIWDPIKKWYNIRFERTLLATMRRCKDEVRRVLREDVLKEEIKMLNDADERSLANKDSLTAAHSAIEAQGIAMRHLETAAQRLELLPETIERVEGAMSIFGRDLSEILGRLKERDKWDGINRRKGDDGGRRESDRNGDDSERGERRSRRDVNSDSRKDGPSQE